MPRRFGLPSVYLAAAVVTALATAAPLTASPASGLAARPPLTEPTRLYIVTARDRADARKLVGQGRWRVRRYYTAALPGFASWLTAAEVRELRADPRVRWVEPDRPILPMPLARARRAGDRGGGRGSTVYVVDGGVDVARFGDRAWSAYDATGGTGEDCRGHGTRVARMVAGPAKGLAPQAGVASVRVLGCGGSGSLSDVLAGIDWVHRHARGPAVATLAVDGASSRALMRAMRRLVRSGVFAVAASDDGTCRVAPGGQAFSSAVPRVAGAAARYLELHPDADPSTLASWLKCTAARGAIRQNPSGTLRTEGP
ncbi:S8 family serine peptidase [Nonomuraea sp. NPDC005983]|uniref:S8 family serine peptidase n=1 Tax=Nonomuraea sp. NPDC005983 TaxID=3155595 RepID=UPI0033A7A074